MAVIVDSHLLSRLPASTLLLSIPSLVLHPPTHKHHLQSVALAQHALRRCLALSGLDRLVECRAWTGLAELGLGCLRVGMSDAQGEVENAITKALLIAQKHPTLRLYVPHLTHLSARLAQTIQNNARFAQHTLRRLITSFLVPSDPPHVLFAAHLGLVHSLALSADLPHISNRSSIISPISPVLAKCLNAVQDLHTRSLTKRDNQETPTLVTLLALLIRLQLLVRHGVWTRIPDALEAAEEAFESYSSLVTISAPSTPTLVHTPTRSPTSPTPVSKQVTRHGKATTGAGTDVPPIPPQMHVHLLILAVLIHTYVGDGALAMERLGKLHALLDANPGARFGNGVLEIPLTAMQSPSSTVSSEVPLRPLYVTQTHPRVLYPLAFLVSAVAKRDPVGRKPKKAVFAREGLWMLEREGVGVSAGVGLEGGGDGDEKMAGTGSRYVEKEIMLPTHATVAELGYVRMRLGKMKADLLGEVVNISIMRSEFDEAERALNELTAHVRTYELFDAYAARITLQQAQLAHALGKVERARRCYEVAGWLAEGNGSEREGKGEGRDEWVRVAARAGEVWVRIGVMRRRGRGKLRGREKEGGGEDWDGSGPVDVDQDGDVDMDRGGEADGGVEMEELRRFGGVVAGECEGMGGTLRAVGEVIRACLCQEFVGAKQHLRRALDLATKAQDNHLRALVLALSAAHYLHTARESAGSMLRTCEQLAAGLGAKAKGEGGKGIEKGQGQLNGGKGDDGAGNAQLRLWVGERFLEMYRWEGDMAGAKRQVAVNLKLREVVEKIGARR